MLIPNDSGSSSDSVAIIGGAVGAVILLLMIIVVLCIVILCKRRSHIHYNVNIPNTSVNFENNQTYDSTITNTLDHLYSTIEPGGSNVPLSSHDATTNQYDCPCHADNIHTPHHKAPANTTDSAKEVHVENYATDCDDRKGIHLASSGESDEYGIINQPRN